MPLIQRSPRRSSHTWLWISPGEVKLCDRNPDSSSAWSRMLTDANRTLTGGIYDSKTENKDMYCMAGAMAYLAYKHIRPGTITGDPAGTASSGATSVSIACDADDVANLNAGDVITFAGHATLYTVTVGNTIGNSETKSITISPALTQTVTSANISFAHLTAAETMRGRVQDGIIDFIDQLSGGPFLDDHRTLSPSRNTFGLVCAANMIDWDDDGAHAGELAQFNAWCRTLLGTRPTPPFDAHEFGDDLSIPLCHEKRPNNWGTMAGASRMALALYLNDIPHFDRAVQVFKGWLGDANSYANFRFTNDNSWQANFEQGGPYFGINPLNSIAWDDDTNPQTPDRKFDGMLPDDQRRVKIGDREQPYPAGWGLQTDYILEALQGVICQAVLAARHGYPEVLTASNNAIKRAYAWLHYNGQDFNDADDRWQAWLCDRLFDTNYVVEDSVPAPAEPGKMGGYTDWTTINTLWP